jgi:Putative restriction endonuclease
VYAVVSTDHIQMPPGSVMHIPGSWEDYCQLRDSRGDGAIPRLKCHHGEILLMSPLPRHGREANRLADIVKVLLEHQGHNYKAFTPITMELPEVAGIEPDYCFYINNWSIDITSFTAAKDFLPYQVPEVWLLRNDQLTIHQCQDGQYEISDSSYYLPQISLPEMIDRYFTTAKEQGTGLANSVAL